MDLASQLTSLKIQSRDLTLIERADLACRLAKQLEKAGEYEGAAEALDEFWPVRSEPPNVKDLDDPAKAEVLLRVGALAGWLGSADQTGGSQETAKNLVTQSIDLFEGLDQSDRLAEARGDLALCYWREGSYDEARITLSNALSCLKDEPSELRAILLVRAATVEIAAHRLSEAFRIFNESAPLLEQSTDHALKGTYHSLFAVLFRRLVTPENRNDYIDRALIEYAAASFHFEQAGNSRYLARVENNLGYLFFTIGRYKDAHNHLDRARQLFLELRDIGTAAQVDETRARTLLAEGNLIAAERMVRVAVRTLEKGGEQAVLAEALTTYGIVLARLGHPSRSRVLLERAIEIAETTGDLDGAGRAKLSIIEELGEKIPAVELVSIYRSAIDLLKSSQDPSTGKRLISCAAKLLDAVTVHGVENQKSEEQSWEGFSLKQHIRDSERAVLERALRDAGGSVTKAAHFLGFKHHQSLISLINSRHKELLTTRSTVRKRRQHIFSKPRRRKRTAKPSPQPVTSQISILHVEDHEQVAKLVGEILAAEDWQVELCTDADSALRKLTGTDPYDALVVDNDLPGLNGLELVKRARKITHRRRTPIIMLSGDDCEKEAWGAGVDAFLLKPEGVHTLATTITRVLKEQKTHKA